MGTVSVCQRENIQTGKEQIRVYLAYFSCLLGAVFNITSKIQLGIEHNLWFWRTRYRLLVNLLPVPEFFHPLYFPDEERKSSVSLQPSLTLLSRGNSSYCCSQNPLTIQWVDLAAPQKFPDIVMPLVSSAAGPADGGHCPLQDVSLRSL